MDPGIEWDTLGEGIIEIQRCRRDLAVDKSFSGEGNGI